MEKILLLTAANFRGDYPGAFYAAKIAGGSNQTTITANNNVIINFGAEQANMSPEAFKGIIEAAIQDKKALANDAAKFMAPAKGDPNAGVTFDNNKSVSFDKQVIAAIPKSVKPEKQEKVEHLSDVDLQIRATDLDNTNKGWAGVIQGKIDRRIKLKLGEGILPADIADKFKVRADVSIYYKLQTKGNSSEMVPDYILLRDVVE